MQTEHKIAAEHPNETNSYIQDRGEHQIIQIILNSETGSLTQSKQDFLLFFALLFKCVQVK